MINQLVSNLVFVSFVLLWGCNANNQMTITNATKSELRSTDEGYRIFLDGKPFYIQGAGVSDGNLEALASHGANSFRTWSTDNGKAILDQGS